MAPQLTPEELHALGELLDRAVNGRMFTLFLFPNAQELEDDDLKALTVFGSDGPETCQAMIDYILGGRCGPLLGGHRVRATN